MLHHTKNCSDLIASHCNELCTVNGIGFIINGFGLIINGFGLIKNGIGLIKTYWIDENGIELIKTVLD